MVNKTTQAAQAFNGANGATNATNVAAMVAFINANGLGNVALQLTPNALANGTLFGAAHCGALCNPKRLAALAHAALFYGHV